MVSALRLPDNARNTAWQAMRTLSADYGYFSIATIAALTPAAYAPVAEWIGFLAREHVIAPVPGRRGHTPTFAVEIKGEAPPLSRMTNGRCAQQQRQMWPAMRKEGSWRAEYLAEAASTEECEVTAQAARTYSRALQKAGMVEDRDGLWRLKPASDRGPRAPVVCPGGVFDLNVGRFVNLNAASPARRAA